MMNSNEINTADTNSISFDPIVLILDVMKRWLLVVLFSVAVGVGSYICTDLTYEPVYRTSMTFVVMDRGSSSTIFSNLSSTSNVASVFSDLLNSSLLRKSILEDLGTGSFNGSISASQIRDTNLINVNVSASDPRTAYVVAQAIIDHHEEITYQVVDGVSIEALMRPSVPTAPANQVSSFRRMVKMMLFAGLAAIVGLGYLSMIQNKVRSGKEARIKLDCNYLGEIRHEHKRNSFSRWIRKKKTGILIHNPTTSFQFVETIRKLRRRVEQRMHGSKVLMVTSLLENEGKSTVAVNLALSMAQKKERVLLIDCDLRKPACYNLLQIHAFDRTVTDVITGKCGPTDGLIREKTSGLYLLLEKRGNTRSGDLVASQRMQELIAWAGENFDFVVLDMPPMGEVSDAEAMAKFADASLLVVRQNVASAEALNKAVSALEKGRAKLLGCILNNVYSTDIFSGRGHSYGYGYGYRYGKYGKYGRYGNYGSYYGGNSEKNAQH